MASSSDDMTTRPLMPFCTSTSERRILARSELYLCSSCTSTMCSAEAYEHERLFQQLYLDNVGRIDIRLRPPRSDCGPYCDNPLSSLSMLHTWMSCCIVSARCSNLSLTIEKYALGTCYDDLPRSLSRGLLAGFRIGRYARVWDQWEKAYRMKIDFSDQDSRATKDLHLLLPRDLQ